jgi:hypothetical protein
VTTRSGGRQPRAWIVIAIVLVGAVVLLITAAVMVPEERHSDIWVNLAGSAAQIVVLAISGGVVGAVLRDREVRRDDARRRREQLLAFGDRIDHAFHEIKAARRLLRTFGFDAPTGKVLTADQATGFRAQMAQLNDTQLTLETYARMVDAQRSLFGTSADEIRRELQQVSASLRGVLLEWETDPTVIEAGADASALAGWPRFGAFVRYDEPSRTTFRQDVAGPIARVTLLLIRADDPTAQSEDDAGSQPSSGTG